MKVIHEIKDTLHWMQLTIWTFDNFTKTIAETVVKLDTWLKDLINMCSDNRSFISYSVIASAYCFQCLFHGINLEIMKCKYMFVHNLKGSGSVRYTLMNCISDRLFCIYHVWERTL